jgi:hypothetical protein
MSDESQNVPQAKLQNHALAASCSTHMKMDCVGEKMTDLKTTFDRGFDKTQALLEEVLRRLPRCSEEEES